jgi:branched-chain amino acid aminotransferase
MAGATDTMRSSPKFLSVDGEVVPYADARVHVLSSAFKYGITVYEGIRAYWSESAEELYLFRLTEHLERLAESAKIARIELPVSLDQLRTEICEVIRTNSLRQDLHIRVLCYIAADDGFPWAAGPTGRTVAAMPMERYPEDAPTATGVHAGISHWTRLSDAAMPPRVKAAANYMNSRLSLMQARADGYDDAILLDADGKLTEGPGYNIFVARRSKLLTPPVTAGILEGITRDSLIAIARTAFDIDVTERPIDKTELYVAEEAFFCGSAKEVTPILSVDRYPLGTGQPGPLTTQLQKAFLNIARDPAGAFAHWKTPVYSSTANVVDP